PGGGPGRPAGHRRLPGWGGVSTATAASPVGAAPALAADTLPGTLLHRARTTPDHTALRAKRRGVWKAYTWRDYAERASAVALGLESLGVGPGDRVAIHSEN